jgi:hypothetical protein
MPHPVTEYVAVTPKMAEEWLKANTSNRRISEIVVEAYARDMRAGAWKLTHQGIGFDTSGRLLDGQHRLHAILKAGFPVMMAVTRGLSASAQEVVDAQKPRSVADQLGLIDGLPSANKYAGACRVIAEIEAGKVIDKYTLAGTRAILATYKEKITNLLGIVKNSPFDSVLVTGSLAFCMAADESRIRIFAKQIRDGEGLKRTDPAYLIREYVLKQGCRNRRPTIALVVRGAYDFLHGEAQTHYRVTDLADPESKTMAKIYDFFRLANRT